MNPTIQIPRFVTTFFAEPNVEIEVPAGGQPEARQVSYNADKLKLWDKSLGFMSDPKFLGAYASGMNSGHVIMREGGGSPDLHIEFRVHILISAAVMAARLPGDFVECGVNTGIYSRAICDFLDFNSLDKSFFLFDTFEGVPEEQARPDELERVRSHKNWYPDCFEAAKANFAGFPRAELIRGRVPGTLSSAGIDRVCFLSIDMNIVEPERAAIEFFWDKLSVGAPVILDDYAWAEYTLQRQSMDDFAASKGTAIMTLPTGQGMLIKT